MSLEDLQALEVETKSLDAENQAPGALPGTDPESPPPMDYNAEAAQAVDMFAALVVGYAPKTADIWNDETKARVSAALGPVMEKYSVSFGALPPELKALVVAGPPLYMSMKIVAAQMQADRKPAKNEKGETYNQEGAPAAPSGEDKNPLDVGRSPQMALYGQ